MEEKYKIHAAYVLTILIAIIVLLITVRWSQIPQLAALITFALTLSSLILALLAIGYAVYSNSSISENISTLNNASKDVSITARTISEAANDLSRKIEIIPSRLESVELKVDRMLVAQTPAQDTTPPTQEEKAAALAIIPQFIDRISLFALVVLYACSIASRKNVPINVLELSKHLDYSIDMVVIVLNATYATGLVNRQVVDNMLTDLEVSELFHTTVANEITERIKASDTRDFTGTGFDRESYRAYLLNRVASVDQYFGKARVS